MVARSRGVDILTQGSGNPGASNVARVLGSRWGAVVFLLDAVKGALPALIGLALDTRPGAYAMVSAAVLGHMFPASRKFRGGKGVATMAGAMLVLHPLISLALLAVWVVARKTTGKASVASLLITVGLPVGLAGTGAPAWEIVVRRRLVLAGAGTPHRQHQAPDLPARAVGQQLVKRVLLRPATARCRCVDIRLCVALRNRTALLDAVPRLRLAADPHRDAARRSVGQRVASAHPAATVESDRRCRTCLVADVRLHQPAAGAVRVRRHWRRAARLVAGAAVRTTDRRCRARDRRHARPAGVGRRVHTDVRPAHDLRIDRCVVVGGHAATFASLHPDQPRRSRHGSGR